MRGEMVARYLAEIKDHECEKPKRQGFYPAEEITLVGGWGQIVAGTWRGVGLLDVLEPLQHTWGRQVIIAESGRDRVRLQACYPGLLIFEPAEFMDAVEHWPDNEALIKTKRIFHGDIQGMA